MTGGFNLNQGMEWLALGSTLGRVAIHEWGWAGGRMDRALRNESHEVVLQDDGIKMGSSGSSAQREQGQLRVAMECGGALEKSEMCNGACAFDQFYSDTPSEPGCRTCNHTQCEVGSYRVKCSTSRNRDGFCSSCSNAPPDYAIYLEPANLFDSNCTWACIPGYSLKTEWRAESVLQMPGSGGVIMRKCTPTKAEDTGFNTGTLLMLIVFLFTFGGIYFSIFFLYVLPRVRARYQSNLSRANRSRVFPGPDMPRRVVLQRARSGGGTEAASVPFTASLRTFSEANTLEITRGEDEIRPGEHPACTGSEGGALGIGAIMEEGPDPLPWGCDEAGGGQTVATTRH